MQNSRVIFFFAFAMWFGAGITHAQANYNGGAEDGFASGSITNGSTSISLKVGGGSNDGFGFQKAGRVEGGSPLLFKGGPQDGFSFASAMNIPEPNFNAMFKGGINDGFDYNSWAGTVNVNLCLGDFNQSQTIDAADLLIFLSDYGCTMNCLADITAGPEVNATDLLEFLALFGTPCP